MKIEHKKPFIVNCAYCKKEIRLLKDSTNGQKVYCGDCWDKLNKKIGEK